jgi:hypothetical protein
MSQLYLVSLTGWKVGLAKLRWMDGLLCTIRNVHKSRIKVHCNYDLTESTIEMRFRVGNRHKNSGHY